MQEEIEILAELEEQLIDEAKVSFSKESEKVLAVVQKGDSVADVKKRLLEVKKQLEQNLLQKTLKNESNEMFGALLKDSDLSRDEKESMETNVNAYMIRMESVIRNALSQEEAKKNQNLWAGAKESDNAILQIKSAREKFEKWLRDETLAAKNSKTPIQSSSCSAELARESKQINSIEAIATFLSQREKTAKI